MKRKPYKISTKLLLMLTTLIVSSFLLVILVNTLFLPRYYLHQMEDKVATVTSKLKNSTSTERTPKKLKELAKNEQVTIIAADFNGLSNDDLNESLHTALIRERIALNRFWVTEDTIQQLQGSPKSIQKLYDQGKQKSSFLVHLQILDNQLYLVGISLVDFSETATIINTFTFISLGLILTLALLIIYISTKKITEPLSELKRVTEQIAKLNFIKVEDIPPNEIGELAIYINKMSADLEHYQLSLLNKNQQLKQFTADLTHELKTPIALIKAYGNGIIDDLDDGSYLATILKQADLLSLTVDQMLDYAKLEQQDLQVEKLDVKQLFKERLSNFQLAADTQKIIFKLADQAPAHRLIDADRILLARVFDNLLSNALKYTTAPEITITWEKIDADLQFSIQNKTSLSDTFEPSKLLEAFYVEEKSRNKNLAGTGLGLAIVNSIIEQHQFELNVSIQKQMIQFKLLFPLAD